MGVNQQFPLVDDRFFRCEKIAPFKFFMKNILLVISVYVSIKPELFLVT